MCRILELVPTACNQLSREGLVCRRNQVRAVPGTPCDSPAPGLPYAVRTASRTSGTLCTRLWSLRSCRVRDGREMDWTRRAPTRGCSGTAVQLVETERGVQRNATLLRCLLEDCTSQHMGRWHWLLWMGATRSLPPSTAWECYLASRCRYQSIPLGARRE